MASVFDLHVHTVRGSSDSSLTPQALVEEARRLGLRGVCLAEHSGWADRHEFERFRRQYDLILVRALEIDTDMGHIVVLGLDGYLPGVSNVRELRRAVRRVGGYMVAAHPFRNLFNPPPYNRSLLYREGKPYPRTPQEALQHPLFELVDEIEVVNGANTDRENLFSLEVARRLGKHGTGGSDAHSTHGLGKGVTIFDVDVQSEGDLLEALRVGCFSPAEGFHVGRVRHYNDELLEGLEPLGTEMHNL
ncbi:MAG: PHP domain-containing protein [Chloroflexi bacterium]|nr:PHP domain-containing protein [Chloroflexota bacterium]